MSAEVNNSEITSINREIYRIFKIIQSDGMIVGGGTPLHLLIVKDKPEIANLVRPKEFIFYINDEISQYDKSGNFVDRNKAVKIWNMMNGYYPIRMGGMNPETYFASLKLKNSAGKKPEEKSLLRNKYKEAYY
jgi:hypothetical protein